MDPKNPVIVNHFIALLFISGISLILTLKRTNIQIKKNIVELPKFDTVDLPDNSIDFFWTTEVIEHMGREFIAPWLDDANRVLRPGGLIYVSTPNHDGSNDKLPEDHVYEWGFEELKEELEEETKKRVENMEEAILDQAVENNLEGKIKDAIMYDVSMSNLEELIGVILVPS